MTARRKGSEATVRITQVHSIIGNQERVKKVVTSGLGLGRIGQSVVLPDNPYTRGMVAKAAHIVRCEAIAEPTHAGKAAPVLVAVPEAVEELVEAVVATAAKPRRKKPAEGTVDAAPARPGGRSSAAKDEE